MKLFRTDKKLFAIVYFLLLLMPLSALNSEIVFENPDINSENKILYTVKHSIKGCPEYRTAFMADAAKSSVSKILTCYPEKMELLSKGSVLQIRNRYGTARYSMNDSSLTWVEKVDTIPAGFVKLGPQAVSPDGKWLCYVNKKDVSTGELILKNVSTMDEVILNEKSDFSYKDTKVLWSPDSSTLIYEKKGRLFFCDPKALFQKVQMSEEYRLIGDGNINAVKWAGPKTLVYINNDMVYKLSSNELYTRALYAQMVGSGTVIGRLTVKFDSAHDQFWVNETADTLVIVQSNNIISLFNLDSNNFSYFNSVFTKSLSNANGLITDYKLFWANGGEAILWVNTIGSDNKQSKTDVYRITDDITLYTQMDNIQEPVLSDDSHYLAFAQGSVLYVYDLSSWSLISSLKGEKLVSYIWNTGHELIVGGVSTVRSWKPLLGRTNIDTSRILFLSSVKDIFWSSNNAVYALDASRSMQVYNYDIGRNVWHIVNLDSPLKQTDIKHTIQNGKYRVFTGSAQNLLYKNAIYIRTLAGKSVTRALYADTVKEGFERKKVAIIIDALDSSAGLTHILSVLKEYNIDSTFFLNGEFIRRYPSEVKQIVSSGFDCASMFFTNADLTEKGFFVDNDFIRRGLARNEDEFFTLTGSELSLLWHAPHYRATKSIKQSGQEAGYKYIEAGRFSLDVMTLENAAVRQGWYLSASEIISFYTENAVDGSIIPVSTGIAKGSRTDYLYEKLDLLIASLLDSGYEIVSLRSLM